MRIEPPPTYAEVIFENPHTGQKQFTSVWLKWFLDLARYMSDETGENTMALTVGKFIQGYEQLVAPDAPPPNWYRIYAEDDGSGKTRLMVKFATGAAQQIAIEP